MADRSACVGTSSPSVTVFSISRVSMSPSMESRISRKSLAVMRGMATIESAADTWLHLGQVTLCATIRTHCSTSLLREFDLLWHGAIIPLCDARDGYSRYPNLTISFLMLAAISRYLRCNSRSFTSSPEVSGGLQDM